MDSFTTTTSTLPLTEDEVRHYHEFGYVVPKFRLDEAARTLLADTIAKVVSENPHLENKLIANAHTKAANSKGLVTDGGLMHHVTNPDILDMVEQVMGPDLIAWTATIFHKPAAKGKRTPWHRDGEFYPIHPMSTMSVWTAVSHSNTENGCLRVVPGSHRWEGVGFYEPADDGITPGGEMQGINEADAVDIVLKPGEMVLFDVGLVHGAKPNLGTIARTGVVVRYMPATSFYDHDEGEPTIGARPLILVRGTDRSGNDFQRNLDPADLTA